jgi:hypothetical protein
MTPARRARERKADLVVSLLLGCVAVALVILKMAS